tara:strand:+ start:209 stop:931 length:723 start_codon:yes stop_codon:yes gene_type:complete
VEEILRIRKASFWIFILPVVAINLCLLIATNSELLDNTIFNVDPIGRSGFTIPYFDGGVSISRVSRTYPAYLLFKPGMIITSVFLIWYWILNNKLFLKTNDEIKNKSFLFFGVGSAIFLIFHAIFLGINIENDLYKFFRRFLLLGFIIFEVIAQSLLVINIYKSKEKLKEITNENILRIKMVLVSVLVIVAVLSAPILNSNEYTHFKHALEWNYFLGVVSFYLLSFLFWKKSAGLKNQKF